MPGNTRPLPRPTSKSPRKHPVEQEPAIGRSRRGGNESAPIVESGETSTRWPPIKIDEAIASGLPPPSLATRPGTLGNRAGKTTPEVLL